MYICMELKNSFHEITSSLATCSALIFCFYAEMFKNTGRGLLNWLDNPLCCGQQFEKYWCKVKSTESQRDVVSDLTGFGIRFSRALLLPCFPSSLGLSLSSVMGIMGSMYSWAMSRVKREEKVQPILNLKKAACVSVMEVISFISSPGSSVSFVKSFWKVIHDVQILCEPSLPIGFAMRVGGGALWAIAPLKIRCLKKTNYIFLG